MRLPWAPLNFGVFLIILGALMLTSLLPGAPVTPPQAIPLVFTFFGFWLILASFIMPAPVTSYAAPRTMILGWGALLAGLGTLWYVGFNAPSLFPIVFALMLIVAGIGAVGYALVRAQAKKGATTVA